MFTNCREEQWNEFAKQPESIMLPVVQEFYANFLDDDQEWVPIRRVKVYFDQANINNIFKSDTREDGYYEYIQSLDEDGWEETLLRVCKLEMNGKKFTQGASTINRTSLLPTTRYGIISWRLVDALHSWADC